MPVRIFKSIIPLNITDVLVAYEEDGTPRNRIISDAQLAGKVWALRSQEAAVNKAHDDAIMAAQSDLNTSVQAADEAYQAALAGFQQKFVAGSDAADNAKEKALKPIQKSIDIVNAEAFAAANKLLPPVG